LTPVPLVSVPAAETGRPQPDVDVKIKRQLNNSGNGCIALSISFQPLAAAAGRSHRELNFGLLGIELTGLILRTSPSWGMLVGNELFFH
jgi:hypothetical protein